MKTKKKKAKNAARRFSRARRTSGGSRRAARVTAGAGAAPRQDEPVKIESPTI